MSRKFITVATTATTAVLLLLVGALSAATVFAMKAFHEPADSIVWVDMAGHTAGDPVVGASATLIRTNGGLTIHVLTNGLTPGHIMTVWTKADDPNNGIPTLKPFPGARGIVGKNGVIRLSGSANANKNVDDDPPSTVPLPDDFDPLSDVVQLLVQDHGPKDNAGDQLTGASQGCNLPGNVCKIRQRVNFDGSP